MNIRNQPCKSSVTCLSPLTDLASLFTDDKIPGRPIRAEYRDFKTIREQTSDSSPTDSSCLLELMIIQTRMRDFVKLHHSLVCQFTVSFNTFLSMSLHVVGPRHRLCVRFLPHRWFFCWSSRNTWLKHLRIFFNDCFIRFAFTPSASQVHMVKKWCGFVNIRIFDIFFHIRSMFCFFPAIFWGHPQILAETTPVSDERAYIPSSEFPPIQVLTKLLRIVSHRANGWPYKILSQGLQMFAIILATCVVEDVSKNIWTFRFGNVEQSGSIFQFYPRTSRYCTSSLCVTTW